ncbi:MAG: VWA domain-containing protein [Pyrinomonadaceae bacterium]
MKKIFLLSFFIFAFPLFVSAQTPTPAPDEDVVKITTALIQVDVTVTDKKGNVVTDLKPEEFEIYENGEKQDITNFSFVANVKTGNEASKNPVAEVPVPTAELKPQQVRRTMALVVDDLSLSFESAYQVRRALKKFVDEQMQSGDLVAIIRTGAGIGALQQFTSDKRQLYAAIEKVRWNPLGRGNISAFAPVAPTMLEQSKANGSQISEEMLEAEKDFNENTGEFQESIFATGTLGALKFIVGGMRELPGRKSVVLFSDGFKLFTTNAEGVKQQKTRVVEFLRQLVDLANRSSVVFYTMDARGLQCACIMAEDNIIDPSGENLQKTVTERSDELFDTQEGLVYLARQTGGFAVVNNNDLSGGVRKILDDQSYYLVGYQPDTNTFDAKTRRFNKLIVKVKREGLSVRYRSGFFNVNDEKIAQMTAVKQTPLEQINKALASPFAVSDISLRLNTLFGSDAKGSYVRSLLHINAQDLKFTDEKDGSKKAIFDVLAVSFGDNGQIIDQIGKSYTLSAKGATYERILKDGFVYDFTFPVKKPGAYQYRVAIRDIQTEKVGSASQFIEVPNLKKDRATLSGIVLENFTREQWQAFANETPKTLENQDANVFTNPMNDTSLRRFKRGTILRYGYEIYNVKLDASKKPNVTTQVRIFRDGKLLLEGKKTPLDLFGQTDLERIKTVGALSLGSEMPAGDYILQIIIADNLAKEKQKITTQFVQFELTD